MLILNQNDYIMRQIYQLTQALERVIAVVLGLKGSKQSQDAIEIVNQALTEHLELDIDALLEMDAEEMIQKLGEDPAINHENLEYIADLFFEMGKLHAKDSEIDSETVIFFNRALKIYRHIEADGTVYSLDRNYKIRNIEQLLSEI